MAVRQPVEPHEEYGLELQPFDVLDVEHPNVIVLSRQLTARAWKSTDVFTNKNAVEIISEWDDLILVADQNCDRRQLF
jgi:hypothetical protein